MMCATQCGTDCQCAVVGEAALLGLATHPSAAVVASAHLSALKLQLTDMQQLMHPADLQVSPGVVDQAVVACILYTREFSYIKYGLPLVET